MWYNDKYQITNYADQHLLIHPGAPFTKDGSNLISVCIGNYIHCTESGEIIYPFPSLNGCAIEVWE